MIALSHGKEIDYLRHMGLDMKRFGYARVSTLDQHLDRQMDSLKAHGVNENDIFTDKKSGKDFNRDGFDKLNLVLREGDELYVHSLDRLGRNLLEVMRIAEDLGNRGVKLHFIKENLDFDINDPIKKAMLQMFGLVAELERNMMLERQREGYEAKRRAGIKAGRGNAERIDRNGIISALKDGKRPVDIAKEFKVGRATVYRIKEEAEI